MTDKTAEQTPALGIDIGGSGIKGAPVDLHAGEMMTDRLRITTPAKSTPKNVAAVVGEIVDNFKDTIGDGPIGITVPAVVTHGKTRSAANIRMGCAILRHYLKKQRNDVAKALQRYNGSFGRREYSDLVINQWSRWNGADDLGLARNQAALKPSGS